MVAIHLTLNPSPQMERDFKTRLFPLSVRGEGFKACPVLRMLLLTIAGVTMVQNSSKDFAAGNRAIEQVSMLALPTTNEPP